ncbi:MAG: MbnP family copper-binding protein [Acidobacteriota bacterium]
MGARRISRFRDNGEPKVPTVAQIAFLVASLTAILGTLGGCGGPDVETYEITFEARVGDEPARCGVRYRGVGVGGGEVEIGDARFYVSALTLLRPDGTEVPLQLDPDSPWQHADVALLDFEDGTGRCSEAGTREVNAVVRGAAPAGPVAGLRFELGVPFETNHLDATTAPSPMNLNAMYWNWRFGYIFTKVDFWNPDSASAVFEGTEAGAQTPTRTYLVHLGSTGCPSPAATVPPKEPCTRPNRVSVILESFDPKGDVVQIDLGALVAGIDLTHSVPRPPGCMAAPDDPDCGPIFANLGLDVDTGACRTDCQDQKLFRRAAGGSG